MITVWLQGQKKLPQSDFFLFANVFSFGRHLAGFILVGKVLGKAFRILIGLYGRKPT